MRLRQLRLLHRKKCLRELVAVHGGPWAFYSMPPHKSEKQNARCCPCVASVCLLLALILDFLENTKNRGKIPVRINIPHWAAHHGPLQPTTPAWRLCPGEGKDTARDADRKGGSNNHCTRAYVFYASAPVTMLLLATKWYIDLAQGAPAEGLPDGVNPLKNSYRVTVLKVPNCSLIVFGILYYTSRERSKRRDGSTEEASAAQLQ